MSATETKKAAGATSIPIDELFHEARKQMEEFVETFNRISNQVLDIFENQAASVSEAQRRGQDLIENSVTTLRSSVQGVLDTNSKIFDSWKETVDRFVKPSK